MWVLRLHELRTTHRAIWLKCFLSCRNIILVFVFPSRPCFNINLNTQNDNGTTEAVNGAKKKKKKIALDCCTNLALTGKKKNHFSKGRDRNDERLLSEPLMTPHVLSAFALSKHSKSESMHACLCRVPVLLLRAWNISDADAISEAVPASSDIEFDTCETLSFWRTPSLAQFLSRHHRVCRTVVLMLLLFFFVFFKFLNNATQTTT